MAKKPFSGKQKKDQLKLKKERKRVESAILEHDSEISLHDKRQLAKEILNGDFSKKRINNNNTFVHKKIVSSTGLRSSNKTEEKDQNESDNTEEEDLDNVSHSSEVNDVSDEDEDEDEEDEEDEEEEDNRFNNNRNKIKNYSNLKDIEKQLKIMDLNKQKKYNTTNKTMVNSNGRNKLVTIFEKESKEEVKQRKLESTKPLDTTLRLQPWLINQNFNVDSFIDIPKRLKWSFTMTPDKLKEREREMFINWLEDISEKYDKSRLNYFEHNLEVWRQLWRVSERSDIILLITDARYPLFHFPPALYNYIVNDLKKPMVLVLNKIDLVDKRLVQAWMDYFKLNYPNLSIISFSSFTAHQSSANEDDTLDTSKKRKLKRGVKKYESSRGKYILVKEILSFDIKKSNSPFIVEDIQKFLLQNNIDMEDYEEDEESHDDSKSAYDDDDSDYDDDDSDSEVIRDVDDQDDVVDRPSDSIITVGMVGHPNVGKSSLINGLMGRKVVSTSRTPGHTKHFQTILLSKSIQLCDCPGLVFPALDRPKPLQILCGLFPIAQVREPYSALRYLAERIPLEKVYSLDNPEGPNKPWSPFGICEAFAKKRGYIIANTKGVEDTHRAGLEILRDCVDGNVVISWPPPNFTKEDYIKCGLSKLDTNNTTTPQQQSKSIATVGKIKPLGSGKKKQRNRKKVIDNIYSVTNSDSDEDKFHTTFHSEEDEEDEEEEEDEDEMPLKVYKKNRNPSATKNNNNNKSSNNVENNQQTSKKEKKLSGKALEYQERLAEKQNKGGNKRQIL